MSPLKLLHFGDFENSGTKLVAKMEWIGGARLECHAFSAGDYSPSLGFSTITFGSNKIPLLL